MRGKPGILRLMELLKGLKTGGNTDLNASLSRFACERPVRGWSSSSPTCCRRAASRKASNASATANIDVVLAQTLAPQELQPELIGDVRSVDMETKAGMDVSANRQVMQAYARRLNAFIGDIQSFAHKAGCSHVLASTGNSFEDWCSSSSARWGWRDSLCLALALSSPCKSRAGFSISRYAFRI